jgi:hypothetical protein
MPIVQDQAETTSAQKRFLNGLWPRKKPNLIEAVDQTLDDALERLSQALNENTEVCDKIRRRQSSGELKLMLSERLPES